ncbi:MAG: acetylornithine deacetylase [Rhodospirillaceae bacterium]|nr:MAG: acetylornithine deacetylase [Rhodospirillaceae bacterium]
MTANGKSRSDDDLARAIAMLAKLVAFDTTSRNSNLAFIDAVRVMLAEHGIPCRLVHNDEGTKANLLATVGPMVAGGIVLSGHTDVVPVDDQKWQSDPFILEEREGLLYGRGAADMKGFLAVILAALDHMTAANLKIPLHFAFSYDEEVGCLGAPSLIRFLQAELPAPAAVIVGEPTEMKVVTAHKGITAVRTTVTGHEAHSSQPHRGVSAVMVAAELISFLQGLAGEAATSGKRNQLFEPPHTTITVNRIEGGTALNILARHCTFQWDVRALPEDDPDRYIDRFLTHCRDVVLPRMRTVATDCDIETIPRTATPPLKLMTRSAAEELCRTLTGDNTTRAVSFAAEAGQFQGAGLSTVICGPGSISQAHQPNEFIAVEQLAAGTRFIRDLIVHASR